MPDVTSLRNFLDSLIPYVRKLPQALAALVVVWLLARFVSRAIGRALVRARVDAQLTLLLSRIVLLGGLLLGLVVFFAIWIDQPTLVFGAFGLATLAFSLAFQDILKNWLSGMFLLLERPFRIGDEIEVDGMAGTVLNVELRSTTLRTLDGQEIRIPNAIVYSKPLYNRTRFDERQYAVTARLPADVPVDGLTQSIQQIVQQLGAVRPSIGISPNIDGGLMLEVRYWLNYATHDPREVQTAIGQRVYRLIQEAASGRQPKCSGTEIR